MKKIKCVIILTVFFISCSFDNSSRIWTGNQEALQSSQKDNLKLVFKKKIDTLKKIELNNKQLLILDEPQLYSNWEQRYQNNNNNVNNIKFSNIGNIEKYSKISKSGINSNILLSDNKIFFSDQKGNIGIFSLTSNRLIFKFNFYKKKFKKTKKIIQLLIKDDLIIAADNLGYIYCLNYKKNKLIWAKNMLIPFRSNIKNFNNTLFLSDEKNKIILVSLIDGKKLDEFYTQPAKTVSDFKSNFALDNNKNLLFLSTSGTLYSLNTNNNKIINWIQNFNLDGNITFQSNPIVVSDNIIIIASENQIAAISTNGKRIWELEFSSKISPVVSGNTVIVITKKNFLVIINKETGKVLYSNNIHTILKDNFKEKFAKKIKNIKNVFLLNKKLLLISDNSYFVELNLNNNLKLLSVKRNPFKISSDIIFIDDKMFFVSEKNRVYKVN